VLLLSLIKFSVISIEHYFYVWTMIV